jgi:glycosyltransferase involved in cell wall biosynthesis
MPQKSHVTVGVPVYRSWDFITETLKSIERQTHKDFTVLISVDGNDERSADACRQFLADSRFRLTIQTQRLGWAGNINWLLSHAEPDLFCYYQHDDHTDPSYFELLAADANKHPEAAVCFSDLIWMGTRRRLFVEPTLTGTGLERVLGYIRRLAWLPFRGVIRHSALKATGLLHLNKHDSYGEDVIWLTKLARYGDMRRIPKPLYFKRGHAESIQSKWLKWTNSERRQPWIAFCVGLLEAALPAATTHRDRGQLVGAVVDRLIGRAGLWAFYRAEDDRARDQLLLDFFAQARRQQLCELRWDAARKQQVVTFAATGKKALSPSET